MPMALAVARQPVGASPRTWRLAVFLPLHVTVHMRREAVRKDAWCMLPKLPSDLTNSVCCRHPAADGIVWAVLNLLFHGLAMLQVLLAAWDAQDC